MIINSPSSFKSEINLALSLSGLICNSELNDTYVSTEKTGFCILVKSTFSLNFSVRLLSAKAKLAKKIKIETKQIFFNLKFSEPNF